MNTTRRDGYLSTESVVASLEDFISRANDSRPPSNSWELSPSELQMIRDDAEESEPTVLLEPAARRAQLASVAYPPSPPAPPRARGRRNPFEAPSNNAAAYERAPIAAVATPVPAHEPTPFPQAVAPPFASPQFAPTPAPFAPPPAQFAPAASPFAPAPASPFAPGPFSAKPFEPASFGAPFAPQGAVRYDQTDSVVPDLGRSAPWTAKPAVWIFGVITAFIAGAALVFFMLRSMGPQATPTTVAAPTPAAAPAPAPAAAAAPVVTPLAPAAPVVTPLPTDKAAVAKAAPVAPAAAPKPARTAEPHRRAVAAPRAEEPVRHANFDEPKPAARPVAAKPAAAKPAAHHGKSIEDDLDALLDEHKTKSTKKSDDDFLDLLDAPKKSTTKKAKPAHSAKSSESSSSPGGDWVDPFAQ